MDQGQTIGCPYCSEATWVAVDPDGGMSASFSGGADQSIGPFPIEIEVGGEPRELTHVLGIASLRRIDSNALGALLRTAGPSGTVQELATQLERRFRCTVETVAVPPYRR